MAVSSSSARCRVPAAVQARYSSAPATSPFRLIRRLLKRRRKHNPMSKVVHPFAHRLGILRDWRHRWFAVGPVYLSNLKADILLREFLLKELHGMYVGGLEIERSQKQLRVIIKTSRPGLIIGRSGEGSTKLRNSIVSFLTRKKLPVPEIKLDIEEIRSPE